VDLVAWLYVPLQHFYGDFSKPVPAKCATKIVDGCLRRDAQNLRQ
jgi:hypothetical protein